MKNLLLALTSFVLFSTFQVMANEQIAGEWHANLKLPNGELPIVIRLEQSEQGWSGTLDSPSQGGFGIPMSLVKVEDQKLTFEIKAMAIHYEGKLSASSDQISGNFVQGAVLPLTFQRPVDKHANRLKSSDASAVVGTWSGTLNIPGNPLRLVFNIDSENDQLTATAESPDQHDGLIPVESIEFKDGELSIAMNSINAKFSGLLLKSGKEIEGMFTQGGGKLQLTLTPGVVKKK